MRRIHRLHFYGRNLGSNEINLKLHQDGRDSLKYSKSKLSKKAAKEKPCSRIPIKSDLSTTLQK